MDSTKKKVTAAASTTDKRRDRTGDGERNDAVVTQGLPIPEYKMGWIIGKKGTYINQLAKKSGANITVSDSKSKEYGTVWKYVQITGNLRAIDRAKKLLHIRLERLEPKSFTADADVNADVDEDFDAINEEEDDIATGSSSQHRSIAAVDSTFRSVDLNFDV